MELKTIFDRLGFGKNAHRVYNALLHSKKPLLISYIATSAGIDRPEVYRNLKKLLAEGCVATTRIGKRTYYRAESPKKLERLFEKTEHEVEQVIKRIQKKSDYFLPNQISYHTGFTGIRAVFDDVIEKTPKGETFYRFTSENNLEEVNKYLSPSYRDRRDKKKLERLVISNPVSGKQKRSRLERFIKYIPQEADLFDQNIIELVYANRVAFINLNTEEAFIIEDAALARFQKVIFMQLYKKLPYN